MLYLPAVQNAAEVYWNGRLIGSYGKLPPDPVWYDAVWPLGVAIMCPACGRGQFVLGRPESGVLAIRVWTAPYVFFSSPNVGGLTATPELGSAEAIRDQVGRQSSEWLEGSLYTLGLTLVSGIVAVLALLAWLRDRRQWMLFWLAIYTIHAVLLLPFAVPGLWSFRLGYGLIAPVVGAEDVSLWFLLLYLLNLRDEKRLVRWTLWNGGSRGGRFWRWSVATLPVDDLAGPSLSGVGHRIHDPGAAGGVLVLVAFAFRRKLDAARRLLAIAALLVDLLQAVHDWGDAGARWTHWTIADPLAWPLFTVAGNAFNAGTLADTLLLASILYAVWRYETEQRNWQTLLDEEYRNAQELQRVLIPSDQPALRGFAVSSACHPAQEVGGDFFQIIPNPDDSALIAIGDVSGKGLRAAMAVALIVGALRTLAEVSTDPAQVLAGLNRRLDGRLGGGFATCLVALLQPDGRCVVANAGHLPPFLNTHEVELQGALPLGLNPNERYENQEVVLAPGDRLTLYTDGLLEARDSKGELFGFERLAKLVGNTAAAEDAIAAGVQFGQEDDITVLTVTLVPCGVPA